MLDTGEVAVHLPMPEDLHAFVDELAGAGVTFVRMADGKLKGAAE